MLKLTVWTFVIQNHRRAFCSSADQDLFVHPASGTLSGEAAKPFSDLNFAEAGRPFQLAQLNMGEGEAGNGIWRRKSALNQNNNKQKQQTTNNKQQQRGGI